MSVTEYTLEIKKYDRLDSRLGRHVRHDSRSQRFLVKPKPRSTLMSKQHFSMIPTMDQGDLGSCTGNAAVKNLSYGAFWVPAVQELLSTSDTDHNQKYAIGVYSEATTIDPWNGSYPPDDTGSDGLSVAKVLHKRGLISGYLNATNIDAVLTALQTQAVITGTAWHEAMFDPDPDGRIHITGSVMGGHEYTLDQVDMENQRVWLQNSWGPYWGLNGRAYLTFQDYAALLADWGDATVFVPVSLPAPEPEPAPSENDQADVDFATEARTWLAGHPFFYKKTIQASIQKWLDRKNL